MKIKRLLTTLALMVLFLLVGSVGWAQIATHVVISEVYGGGGNTGAPYKNDYVELYNPTGSAIDISNWSVQYASATGTTWTVTSFGASKTIPARGYFLVKLAGGATGVDLPTAEVTNTGMNLSGTNGKVALVNSTTALSGANPTDASIVDKVGFGTANGYETAAAPAPSNTTSIERKANTTSTAITLASGGVDYLLGNGWDSDNNSQDFVSQSSLSPQNTSSATEPDTQAPQATFNPANAATGVALNSDITITFDEAIRKLDDSDIDDTNVDALITLKKDNSSGADVTFDATIDVDNKIVTINPTADFDFNQVYYVAIASVEDASGNATGTLSASFTSRAASTDATVTSGVYTVTGDPIWTITNIPSAETLATFEGNITPAAGATFDTYLSDGSTLATTDLLTGYKVIVTAEDGATTNTYVITKNVSLSTETDFTAYSLPSQTGAATIDNVNHTISVEVPCGTDVTALIATFSLSPGANAKVGTDAQTSATTPNNFTSPVTYIVTAEDGSTTQDWVVTVTFQNHLALTAPNGGATYYAGDIIEASWTSCNITNVKVEITTNGTDWTELIATTPAADGKENITIPSDIYSTTCKVRITDLGTSGLSDVSDADFTIIPTVSDLATLRSKPTGATKYKYTGEAIITFAQTFRNQKWMQDATAGIVIDDNTNVLAKAWVRGDKVTGIVGTLGTNNGNLQFIPTASGSDPISSGHTVTPTVITVTDLNTNFETYESQLVKMVNLSFTSVGNFANGVSYGFKDAGEVAGNFRTTFFDVDYISTAIPTAENRVTITGILNSRTTAPTNLITARDLADFQSSVATVSSATYTVDGGAGTITNIHFSHDLATFEGNLTPAAGATFETYQADGTTVAADLQTGYKVIVTAQDGLTTKTYTITMNVASADATVTSTVYTVNSTDNTITNISYAETLAAFEGNITPAAGATFETYLADGTTVATDLATGYKLICTAEDGTTKKTYTITVNTEPSHDANITAYSILGNNGTINAGAKTIAVTVPYGTTLTNLVATFTLSANATAKVGATAQVSGVTTNDFSSPVVYDVTAEDGATVLNWTVTVTVAPASTDATVTSTEYTVNSTAFTITGIPYNETLATFEGNLTPATGATFETYLADGTTVATDLATGYKVIVTAQDGTTKNTYTITLMDAPVGDLFFSEYIEGSSSNKALEIYNGTGSDVDLSIYSVKLFANGAVAASNTQALTGTLVNGEVYVITNTNANATIQAQSDITSTVTFFNGDDAVGLYKNDVLIDVIGVIGTDPGTNWPVAGTGATSEFTLIRKDAVVEGTTDWAASAGTDADNSQWVVYPQDFASGLGSHKQPLPSTDNDILTFTIPTQLGTTSIDNVTHTVVVNMPTGTDVTALVPTITVSTGASISPASGVAQDFTTSKTYTVTAEGGNTQNWNISMVILSNVATLSDIKVDNNSIAGFVSTTYDYTVTLPYGTTATPVVTVNTTDADADAVVTPAADVTSATAADRTTTIAVTAEDGVTTQNYTVLFNVEAPSTDATVTSTVYTVNSTDNTITDVPATETLATFEGNLTPAAGATFETYEADGTTVATNLATGYKVIVTAQDGTTKKTYTVTLNTVLSTAANILTYTVSGVNATVNGTNQTVAATLPYGTNLTALVATYTLSPAATAKVNGVAQQSGVTANDFTNPVVYNVTAEDGTTIVDWTVTITTEAPSADATITSAVYTVNSADNTITNVPYNETLATFEGNLTPATGATFETYQADGTTVATDLASGYKVVVTAQDGTTIKTYTITLNVAPPMDLFISEYIEGGSNNKAIEIYNPTNTTIDLTQYSLKKGTNGADYSTNLPLTGTLEPGDVYVVAHTSAVDSVKSVADYIDAAGTIVYFNGDDPIGLFKGDDLIDVVGVVTGTDPGDGWAVAGTANATLNHTLVRKDNVTIGTTDWTASAGTDAATSQWVVYPQDRFAFLGWHINKSSDNDILTFAFAAQTAPATINATAHTVSIEVLNGTAVTALVPTITVSKFATINPASGAAQDFTNPVVYTVTAQDGTTQTWTVTVTVSATISSQKDITSFSIPNQTSVDINAAAGTVAVVMPFGTDVTSLTPTIAVSAGANINPASGVAQDFTNPVEYTVTAQDASTKVWTVTVSVPDVALTSIHDIQYTTDASGDSPLKGQQVRTKGVVTAMKTGTNSFNMWLQDGTQPWGGIYVYGVDNANAVTVGDSVELFATVDEYYNLTELKTITALNNLGAGTLPAVASIGIADAKTEAYEGMLVKITNVECTVVDAGNGMFTVSDGTNTMNIDDFLYKYTPAQGTRYDITGVIDFSYSEFKVLPRDASDVSINTSATVNPFATFVAYPNPFTNEIRFEGADVARVTVTSIIGQVVMDRTITGENYINTQELVRGIYLVKFTTKKGESVLRKLIKEY